jgi:hypothetical protein
MTPQALALETLLTHAAPLLITWLCVAMFVCVGACIHRRLP